MHHANPDVCAVCGDFATTIRVRCDAHSLDAKILYLKGLLHQIMFYQMSGAPLPSVLTQDIIKELEQ